MLTTKSRTFAKKTRPRKSVELDNLIAILCKLYRTKLRSIERPGVPFRSIHTKAAHEAYKLFYEHNWTLEERTAIHNGDGGLRRAMLDRHYVNWSLAYYMMKEMGVLPTSGKKARYQKLDLEPGWSAVIDTREEGIRIIHTHEDETSWYSRMQINEKGVRVGNKCTKCKTPEPPKVRTYMMLSTFDDKGK